MPNYIAVYFMLLSGVMFLGGCSATNGEAIAEIPQKQTGEPAEKPEPKPDTPQVEETKDPAAKTQPATETQKKSAGDASEKDDFISLFDGKTLDGWEKVEFGGEGDIEVVDGVIRMYAGDPLTGICVAEDVELPKANYEFSLEGMKLEGVDFFASVTFPVNDSFCTLVVGGWGGTLVGLSNLDGRDASDNDTKVRKKFEKDQWYKIRIRVTPDHISAWIDDEQLVDQSIKGIEVAIRNDVISTTPLGITNFITSSQIRNIKIRNLE